MLPRVGLVWLGLDWVGVDWTRFQWFPDLSLNFALIPESAVVVGIVVIPQPFSQCKYVYICNASNEKAHRPLRLASMAAMAANSHTCQHP